MRFYLNLRILADAFEQAGIPVELHMENGCLSGQELEDVRLWSKKSASLKKAVYIAALAEEEKGLSAKTLAEGWLLDKAALGRYSPQYAFILQGSLGDISLPARAAVLCVLEKMELSDLLGFVQDVFSRYREWDLRLHSALFEKNPLDDMLLASWEIFKNPVFCHDSHFHILSDPVHDSRMTGWEKDPLTGLEMVPMDLINDFRTDQEYLRGLKSRKSVLFSAYQTGYRILYRNLWQGNRYAGRVLVDEITSSICPGDFYALDYLGSLIEEYGNQGQLVWLKKGSDLEDFLHQAMENEAVEEQRATRYLQEAGWNFEDAYLVMYFTMNEQEFAAISAYAIVSQIEMELPFSKAFFVNDGVVAVVNASQGLSSMADIAWRLSGIVRDSLLKVGMSSRISSFADFPKACRQAKIAVDFGKSSNSTYWYYLFDDYKLDYMIQCAARDFPLEMLCADALEDLLAYDRENRTELYRTLLTYLKLEKNVLGTSKELFIHRSTLSYRIAKIEKIIGLDLDNPIHRLRLLLSFYMREGKL